MPTQQDLQALLERQQQVPRVGPPPTSPSEMNLGDLLGAGAGAYQANRNINSTQGQINDLRGLFAPGSAYERTMRDELNRRDSQAGRAGQYGAREVNLQAKLAANAAALAPHMAALNQTKQGQQGHLSNNVLQALSSSGLTGLANTYIKGLIGSRGSAPDLGQTLFNGGNFGKDQTIDPESGMNLESQNLLDRYPAPQPDYSYNEQPEWDMPQDFDGVY